MKKICIFILAASVSSGAWADEWDDLLKGLLDTITTPEFTQTLKQANPDQATQGIYTELYKDAKPAEASQIQDFNDIGKAQEERQKADCITDKTKIWKDGRCQSCTAPNIPNPTQTDCVPPALTAEQLALKTECDAQPAIASGAKWNEGTKACDCIDSAKPNWNLENGVCEAAVPAATDITIKYATGDFAAIMPAEATFPRTDNRTAGEPTYLPNAGNLPPSSRRKFDEWTCVGCKAGTSAITKTTILNTLIDGGGTITLTAKWRQLAPQEQMSWATDAMDTGITLLKKAVDNMRDTFGDINIATARNNVFGTLSETQPFIVYATDGAHAYAIEVRQNGNDISVVRPAVRVAHTAIGKPGGDTQSSLTDLMSRANAATEAMDEQTKILDEAIIKIREVFSEATNLTLTSMTGNNPYTCFAANNRYAYAIIVHKKGEALEVVKPPVRVDNTILAWNSGSSQGQLTDLLNRANEATEAMDAGLALLKKAVDNMRDTFGDINIATARNNVFGTLSETQPFIVYATDGAHAYAIEVRQNGNDISVVRPAVRVAHTAIGKPGGDTQSSLTDLMSRANAAGGQARTFDSDADAQNVLNSLPLTN